MHSKSVEGFSNQMALMKPVDWDFLLFDSFFAKWSWSLYMYFSFVHLWKSLNIPDNNVHYVAEKRLSREVDVSCPVTLTLPDLCYVLNPVIVTSTPTFSVEIKVRLIHDFRQIFVSRLCWQHKHDTELLEISILEGAGKFAIGLCFTNLRFVRSSKICISLILYIAK